MSLLRHCFLVLEFHRKMGYVDGKTDLDLILGGDASGDENELISSTQVQVFGHEIFDDLY